MQDGQKKFEVRDELTTSPHLDGEPPIPARSAYFFAGTCVPGISPQVARGGDSNEFDAVPSMIRRQSQQVAFGSVACCGPSRALFRDGGDARFG